MAAASPSRAERLYRPLVAGLAASSLAFVPSWFRILEGTWPAWALAGHSVSVALAGLALGRRRPPDPGSALALCVWAVVVPSVFLMGLRAASEPWQYVHDSAVMTEESMRFLLDGRNPYRESFEGTPVADVPFFGGRNPAVEHYVYYPGSFLLSLPLFIALDRLLGWYDHRLFLLLCYGLGLGAAWKLAERDWRPHLIVAAGLNPAFVFNLVQGANDAVVTGLLLASCAASYGGMVLVSALAAGLACACKQTAWFFAVLLIGELWGRAGLRRAVVAGAAISAAAIALSVPLIAWDADAFVDDTYRYLAGLSKESYPAAGLSVANLLTAAGADPATVPKVFPVLQLGVVLPVLLWAFVRQRSRPGPSWLSYRYSLVVAAAFLCSRYFNASHMAFVSFFFLASFFMPVLEDGDRHVRMRAAPEARKDG